MLARPLLVKAFQSEQCARVNSLIAKTKSQASGSERKGFVEKNSFGVIGFVPSAEVLVILF